MEKAKTKESVFVRLKRALEDPLKMKVLGNSVKEILLNVLKFLILIGVSYVIIAPVIGMFVNSISSDYDATNPMVFLFPRNPTLERYKLAILRMDYWKTTGKTLLYTLVNTLLQLLVCSMVGYGFARFDFPMKKFWFACVVVTIVVPTHTIMLPLYMSFKDMNLFGLAQLITKVNKPGLMGTTVPMYILNLFASGLRSGLFIYIFNQFFRGLPKEIEEAAFVDGAGMWYTYFKIMLRNAMPAVITVTVFSFVWQFNDTFYSKLFLMKEETIISKRLASLQAVIANEDNILSLTIQELYRDAGALLVIAPVVIVYLILQKNFIEGVERSGIVG